MKEKKTSGKTPAQLKKRRAELSSARYKAGKKALGTPISFRPSPEERIKLQRKQKKTDQTYRDILGGLIMAMK